MREVVWMKDKIFIGIALVLSALILGICFLVGVTTIAKVIRNQEIVISDKSLDKMANALQGLMRGAEAPQPQTQEPGPGEKMVEGVTQGTNPVKGKNNNAPVLLVEFSDFQCPYSRTFHQEIFPQIEKEYITTGKIRYAYRDFPFDLHPLAKGAAMACRCAGKQGKYWQMFDKLMLNTALDTESIKKYAQEIGSDTTKLELCLSDQKITGEVDRDLEEGAKLGVRGTPSFFINGRFVVGGYPFDVFKKIIEEELKKGK